MLVEDRQSGIRVIERQHDDLLQDALGGPLGQRHGSGVVRATPVLRRRRLADLGVVVGPVIAPFDLHETVPAGEGARRFQGRHHRLGAGVHEADLVEARRTTAHVPGELDLHLGRHGERGAALQLRRHRLDDRRMGVAVDQRRHVVGEVDTLHAVDVDDAAAARPLGVEGMGGAQQGVAADAAGQNPLRLPEEVRAAVAAVHSASASARSGAPVFSRTSPRVTPGASSSSSSPSGVTSMTARSV